MNEKTLVSLLYELINLKSGLEFEMSIEMGEIALKLFDLLTEPKKRALRGRFEYRDAYEHQIIEIGDTYIETFFVDYNAELTTSGQIAQHGYETDNETLIFDNVKELSKEDRLNLMYEHELKPYMREYALVSIYPYKCALNIPHNHLYVAFDTIFPKSVWNYNVYNDILSCMRPCVQAYFDKLLEQGESPK